MRGFAPKLFLALGALAAAAALLAPAALAAPSYTGMFELPEGTFESNNKIVGGPDGNVWFTVGGAAGNDVGKITPSGEITEYDLPGVEDTNGIGLGPEGKLWVPTTGKITSFSPGDPVGSAKTTESALINSNGQVVAVPAGEMWVASDNAVARFSPANPAGIQEVPLAGELSPKDIDVSGAIVAIADAGHEKLVTFDSASKLQGEVPLNNETMTSQGVAGSATQLAFSKSDGTEGLGLLTPPSTRGDVLMPGDPFGVTLGSDGAFWFAMSAKTGVQRLTSGGQTSFVPFTGLPSVYFPRQIATGPGNTLWVTLENGGENKYGIARVTGLEPPVTKQLPPPPPPISAPETKLAKGPKKIVKTRVGKAKVTFKFSASLPGSTFQCSLTRAPKSKKGKKAKKPKTAPFSGCKSPRNYKLAPGKYSFQVRAVGVGGPDATPAKQTFKVVHVNK